MLLRRHRLREIAFTLGLALTPAFLISACGDKNLHALEVPAAGVKLTYDFTPGQRYQGHVRRGETVQSSTFTINRSIECDIGLTVRGEDPNRGDILVVAKVTNVNVTWKLPPTPMYAAFDVDAIVKQALDVVQNMEVRFNVDSSGKVNFMPPPPQDVEQEVKLVIEQVLESIESAFMEVPRKSVKQGESWDEKEKKGRKGKLGSYRVGTITTTFKGLYRDKERNEDVAKLDIVHEREETVTTKAGSHQNKWEGKTEALFSTSGDYLAKVKGEIRKFDPGTGMGPQTTFTKVRVEWTKKAVDTVAAEAEPTPEAPKEAEVQAITDPCHPDYVGAEECKETETQAITDPCDPDYVGGEECKEEGDDEEDAAKDD